MTPVAPTGKAEPNANEFDPELASPAETKRFEEILALSDALENACAARDPKSVRRAIAHGANPNENGWEHQRRDSRQPVSAAETFVWRRSKYSLLEIAVWRMASNRHNSPARIVQATASIIPDLVVDDSFESYEREDAALLETLTALQEGGWRAQDAWREHGVRRALYHGAGNTALWLIERSGLTPDEAAQGFALAPATICKENIARRLVELGASLGGVPAMEKVDPKSFGAQWRPLLVARISGAWKRTNLLLGLGAPLTDLELPDRDLDTDGERLVDEILKDTSDWDGMLKLPDSDFGERRDDADFEALLRAKRDEIGLREALGASAQKSGSGGKEQGSPRL
jgi:hypothetical protein